MSENPDEGVVNANSMCHEVPNLAIIGASTFPNSGGYNPTGTVQAMAWRAGEYIAENFQSLTS
jgi:gluconate 2-dehydrogenase alpha chain